MITDEQLRAAQRAFHDKLGITRESEDNAMRAALEAAERAAWRPIEEAPRDGTRFMAYQRFKESRYYECWWEHDFALDMGQWQDAGDSEPNPTHYRPLPAPPEDEV